MKNAKAAIFSPRWEVKSLRTERGGEYSRTGGVTDLGSVTFAGEVSTPLHAMLVQNISKDLLFFFKVFIVHFID